MAQDEVIQYLKQHKGKWVSSTEMAENLKTNTSNINRSIFLLQKNMKHWQEFKIEFRKAKNNSASPYKYAATHNECRYLED
jgi:hypothetical protein